VLNFVFWILLGLNAALFAYGQGYLGKVSGNEHEPARVKNQLATDQIKLITPGQAQSAASASPAATETPAPAATPPAGTGSTVGQPVACTEVGTFSAAEAPRFEKRLARLNLGEHLARRTVQEQEVTSYMVYVPPQGSKEAAERKTAELRGLGVENSFILSADSPFKWAISLGVFKSEASAQTLLADLNKQGVHSARIVPRGPQATRFAYQFHDIDDATRAKIAVYADKFESAQVKACR
jgi:hypothetical protein